MHFILIDAILEIVPYTFIYFSLLCIRTIPQRHGLSVNIFILLLILRPWRYLPGQQAEIYASHDIVDTFSFSTAIKRENAC
jgi:hypothetical protein